MVEEDGGIEGGGGKNEGIGVGGIRACLRWEAGSRPPNKLQARGHSSEREMDGWRGMELAVVMCAKCLEELDLSMNPLGDGVSESLSCLLSRCPLLAKLSLQACGLTARFLQQHRLLLASALAGTGHLKSVCLSHNALGSTGFELVLKTLPLHSLTHLDLSAVRKGPADYPPLEHFTSVLSQDECSLTYLSLAANGLTDSSVATLARCLPSCPTLVSLNLSGNPSVTSAGLHNILMSLREAGRPLTLLNLQGCQVSGPWDSACLDGLSELVQDLRLCSQGLNKLDRQALKQSWDSSRSHGHFIDRKSKCLLSALAAS
ncbi:Tonsoku-like protein NF-kappa-B inhibitor-like protein 2 [Collichthys lucidus]|uniref:Tonsoku-like protein NF-kappa-B inhibitor-like protein 2 n=1 Tax=Collichthys lucidus TaxID=240159 RepID=A0A4U5VFA1_COLLU|nr:Tonsoku-like protein NF-kappa-B inhibitor-like protein 2 [Collichthys lucidus]